MSKGSPQANLELDSRAFVNNYQSAKARIEYFQYLIQGEDRVRALQAAKELQAFLKKTFNPLLEQRKYLLDQLDKRIDTLNNIDPLQGVIDFSELSIFKGLRENISTLQLFDKQKMIIPVLDEERAAARAFFEQNPKATYMPHKQYKDYIVHSFVAERDEKGNLIKISAKATGQYLGRGGFGKVVLLQDIDNPDGQCDVFKREYIKAGSESHFDASKQKEIAHLKTFDYFQSEHTQTRTFTKKVDGVDVTFSGKHYTRMTNLGTSLDKIPIRPEHKQNYAVGVAHAIKFVHDKGIVHADLKPANIMVGKEGGYGVIRVTDFGLSAKVQIDGSILMHSKGTDHFMAPEVNKDKGLCLFTFKTDIYAFGVMLKDMRLGRELDPLINLMLNKDPHKRPNIDQVIAVLENRMTLKQVVDQINQQQKIVQPIISGYQHFVHDAAPLHSNPTLIQNADIIAFIKKQILADSIKREKTNIKQHKKNRIDDRKEIMHMLLDEIQQSPSVKITSELIKQKAAKIREQYPEALSETSTGLFKGKSKFQKMVEGVEKIEKKYGTVSPPESGRNKPSL